MSTLFLFPLLIGSLGTPEMIFIGFVVLLLFGSKRLPELARSLARAKHEFAKASQEVQNEIEKIKELPEKKDPPQRG